MARAAWLLVVLALGACSGAADDDDDDMVDTSVGVDDLVAAACAYLYGCADAHGTPPYGSESACVDALVAATGDELAAAEASGDVSVDEDALSACISALAATPCDTFPAELRCEAAFAGTRAEGEPCTSTFACGPGLACTFEDEHCARCQPAEDVGSVSGAFLGDPCSAAHPCLGLFTACEGGACVELPGEGDRCDGRCVGGLGAPALYCADDGRCARLPGSGEDCGAIGACGGEDLRCSRASDTCEALLADGDGCDPDDDLCGGGLVCDGERCAGACAE